MKMSARGQASNILIKISGNKELKYYEKRKQKEYII
jgi:hypothetical protein